MTNFVFSKVQFRQTLAYRNARRQLQVVDRHVTHDVSLRFHDADRLLPVQRLLGMIDRGAR